MPGRETATRLPEAKRQASSGRAATAKRVLTAKEADEVGQRLYSATTKSAGQQVCKYDATEARDVIGVKAQSEAQVAAISDRLASTHTKAWSAAPCKSAPVVATPREAEMTKAYEIDDMVDRLASSHTRASSGEPCRARPVVADNSLSRAPVSDDEKTAILHRLAHTHTKSSQGAPCRSYEPPPPPGLGLKCMPVIDGLQHRFRGPPASSQDKVKDIFSRLSSATTSASRARYANARILLYPERTLLCNNVERIVNYQNTGSVVKQDTLARREKWFN